MSAVNRSMRFLILERLSARKKSTATQVWRTLHERYGIGWRSVNSELSRLSKLGLAESEKLEFPMEGARKTYTITDRGRDILEEYKAGE